MWSVKLKTQNSKIFNSEKSFAIALYPSQSLSLRYSEFSILLFDIRWFGHLGKQLFDPQTINLRTGNGWELKCRARVEAIPPLLKDQDSELSFCKYGFVTSVFVCTVWINVLLALRTCNKVPNIINTALGSFPIAASRSRFINDDGSAIIIVII